jgi:hypothetical protein
MMVLSACCICICVIEIISEPEITGRLVGRYWGLYVIAAVLAAMGYGIRRSNGDKQP